MQRSMARTAAVDAARTGLDWEESEGSCSADISDAFQTSGRAAGTRHSGRATTSSHGCRNQHHDDDPCTDPIEESRCGSGVERGGRAGETSLGSIFTKFLVNLGMAFALTTTVVALDGEIRLHDPSTLVQCNGKFYTYGTGGTCLVSEDGWTWSRAPHRHVEAWRRTSFTWETVT